MSHLHFGDRGALVSSLGYSDAELDALRIARHFFHAFCEPGKQGWIGAFGYALRARGPDQGPQFALATLNAIQAVRQIRHSSFRFNCPTCKDCARYLSGNERSYMSALRAAVRRDEQALAGQLWLLCESNDPTKATEAFLTLGSFMPALAEAPL
ncbi:hypothetical protein LR948_11215 [Roseivivax sp. GX 12232]|uniref:hypothetical protein n=1 Tax=Roseivivax sp. GX 12232 TaxID=2900547 RepID=UPI001E403DF5|nr:hypothetical protein [Roseivivax sp. GX 12232]MCE0505929.1 hypothetical protein [Roseivivax sp. GX 12232]